MKDYFFVMRSIEITTFWNSTIWNIGIRHFTANFNAKEIVQYRMYLRQCLTYLNETLSLISYNKMVRVLFFFKSFVIMSIREILAIGLGESWTAPLVFGTILNKAKITKNALLGLVTILLGLIIFFILQGSVINYVLFFLCRFITIFWTSKAKKTQKTFNEGAFIFVVHFDFFCFHVHVQMYVFQLQYWWP